MNLLLSNVDTKDILLGLLFLLLFFLISVILAVGIKALISFFGEKFFNSEKLKKPSPPKPKRKPIKSIEINPDEVDRIVVKKT